MLKGEVTYISNFKEGYFTLNCEGKEYKCRTTGEDWDKLYNYLSGQIRVVIINKLFKPEIMDWVYTVAIV